MASLSPDLCGETDKLGSRERTYRGVPEKKSRALQPRGEKLVRVPGHGVSPG